MAININHSLDKIKSESDLILDAGAASNIDVSAKIVKNAADPVENQDLVTKIFLETRLATVDGGNDAAATGGAVPPSSNGSSTTAPVSLWD